MTQFWGRKHLNHQLPNDAEQIRYVLCHGLGLDPILLWCAWFFWSKVLPSRPLSRSPYMVMSCTCFCALAFFYSTPDKATEDTIFNVFCYDVVLGRDISHPKRSHNKFKWKMAKICWELLIMQFGFYILIIKIKSTKIVMLLNINNIKTRMKTSISSKVFCSITDR